MILYKRKVQFHRASINIKRSMLKRAQMYHFYKINTYLCNCNTNEALHGLFKVLQTDKFECFLYISKYECA